jgi:branched-chain amino acid transport system permease protein
MKKVLSLLGRYYFVIVFLALLILPRYSKDYVLVLVSDILLYITLTMSWVLFSGPTRYISLAPAAFFGIGVYVVALLGMSMALPWIIAIAACASFVIAFLIGAITLRLRGIYFTMATFGLMELIRHLILWWEVNISGTVGRVVIPLKYTTVYYGMLVIATCVLLTVFFLGRSRLGLALRSIGDS